MFAGLRRVVRRREAKREKARDHVQRSDAVTRVADGAGVDRGIPEATDRDILEATDTMIGNWYLRGSSGT